MPTYKKLKFVIDGFTPLTLPVGRLAEYLKHFAALVGPTADVHLVRVGKGSTQLVNLTPDTVMPFVASRIVDAQRGVGPAEAARGFIGLQALLYEDQTTGRVKEERRKIIEFPKFQPPQFGPVQEDATIEGMLIKIGGRGDTIPVHLQDGENYHKCWTTRAIAKALAPHLFGDPIRVAGKGKWLREISGTWQLQEFKINSFEELNNDELQDVLKRMAHVRSGWDDVQDPLAELKRIRSGSDKVN
jgi:hypothetical protein